MADQEFLASFGMEIDEGVVSKLQSVPAENAIQWKQRTQA